ncbi:hypothetical protein ADZ36_21715 [Streptomyces fradiae]|uniref:Uncharacterized protein n=1 Tax=Streptomyces fradiae TaxID=1906 RepID=A0ACC4W787_STRFR|nr:hypothetical protein ADZ36_21715 [Streptomyces fradiae]OFA38064.1 hypothetical protein BEN35_27975 [Streptomyces fradiae]
MSPPVETEPVSRCWADDLTVLADYDDGLGAVWSPDTLAVAQPSAASVASSGPAPGLGGRGPSITERLAVVVKAEDGADGRLDAVSCLVHGATRTPPVVAVKAWLETAPDETARLLRRVSAAVKEAGLPPEHRPRILLLVRLGDLPEALVDSLDEAVTAVHWWWGVLGRLDTAIVVRESQSTNRRPLRGAAAVRRRILDALRTEITAEVSGPDLAMAAALASRWDGCLSTLGDAIADCLGQTSTAGAAGPPSARRGAAVAHRPELALRAVWDAGAVDSWEGQLRYHASCWTPSSPDAPLPGLQAKMVWQAQNRVLLPLLDDARAEFADSLVAAAVHGPVQLALGYGPRNARSENPAADIAEMELGDIWAAVCHGQVRMNKSDRNRLMRLRHARNCLAHRSPLNDDEVRKVCDALAW